MRARLSSFCSRILLVKLEKGVKYWQEVKVVSITLEVVFDGNVFRPTKPVNLEPNTRMKIIIPDERADWLGFSAEGLKSAYNEEEPEYSLDLIKEKNPDYEGS
jgi:predicted DNA-binding antitoxin AbrB/MazE fold protein